MGKNVKPERPQPEINETVPADTSSNDWWQQIFAQAGFPIGRVRVTLEVLSVRYSGGACH